MPENTPDKRPQPQHKIPAAEFIKAVKGEPFSAPGLYRLSGAELKKKISFVWSREIADDEIVVLSIKIEIDGSETLSFESVEPLNYNCHLMLVQSVLPKINFEKATLKNIYLENSQTGYFRIDNGSTTGDFRIYHNSTTGVFKIDNNSTTGDIRIDNDSTTGYFWIDNNSTTGNIRIDNDSTTGYFWIDNNSITKYIRIDNNSTTGNIRIDNNSTTGSFSIDNNSMIGDFRIDNHSTTGQFSIDKAKAGQFSIKKSLIEEVRLINAETFRIDIFDSYIRLRIRNSSIPLANIQNSLLQELSWESGSRCEMYIDNCIIHHLQLEHTSLLKDALVSISNTRLFAAVLEKCIVQGQLILNRVTSMEKPQEWNLHLILKEKNIPENDLNRFKEQEAAYSQYLKKDLPKLSDKPLFRIANSSLGKTEITGCDLSGFHFEYRDSKILDCFISGTKLPKEKIDIYNPYPAIPLADMDYFEQKVSVYTQLKKIFDNQGHIVEATWYHSKTMENQQRMLQLEMKNKKKGWFSDEAFEFFNFKLNKLSNNHGESWRKAFWFLLISSFIVYSLYYLSWNYHKPFSFKGTGYFFSRFFSFLNITRREDFMVKDATQLNVLSYFFDYFGRVITAFGIYQLIAAFRRHGRK